MAQLDFTWTDPADWGGEEGHYNLYLGTSSGSLSQHDEVSDPNQTSYTFTGLPEGTQHFAAVSAENSVGESPLSNEDSAITAGVVPLPVLTADMTAVAPSASAAGSTSAALPAHQLSATSRAPSASLGPYSVALPALTVTASALPPGVELGAATAVLPAQDAEASTPSPTAKIHSWVLGGRPVRLSEPPELTPQTLSLVFTAPRDDIGHWRQYDRTGDFNVTTGYAGHFRAVDDGGRSGPVTAEPLPAHTPPYDEADWYVESYQETQQAPDRFEVALVLQRLEPRGEAFPPAPGGSGEWEIDTDRGTIALPEINVSTAREGGSAAGGMWTLTVKMNDDQAAALADAAGYPDAVVTRDVPDAEDRRTDTNGGHTVTVSPPAGASVPAAEYIITEWTLSFAGFSPDRRWAVELTLASTA